MSKTAARVRGGFNSTLVRLRQGLIVPTEAMEVAFQFHSGSIKTALQAARRVAAAEFQFHSGSIKTQLEPGSRAALKGFNSTLVRLRPRLRRRRTRRRRQFQFHSGSIKTVPVVPGRQAHSEFQFHSGSIKTGTARMVKGNARAFQFHSGSIKTARNSTGEYDGTCFNSTLVRLRPDVGDGVDLLHCGFNSTLVRLRRNGAISSVSHSILFQFHSGSIKTRAAAIVPDSLPAFQFHSGSIKTGVGSRQ